jgi:Arc/MetJ-type ribon-helix-helix transcriptional regulator
MRTTVEITEEHHRALTALAARRRIRGFSLLVREAIDLYLDEATSDRAKSALALEGTLDEGDADELERRIAEAWSSWPSPL